MEKVKEFLKREVVLIVSAVLALVSIFFVKIDAEYISYIDFRTLTILFSLMAIVAGLKGVSFFDQIAEKLVTRVKSFRGLAITLVCVCFFFSMLITNDVALITFIPFTIIILSIIKKEEKMILIIVLETIAANMGSMMTQIGNPQNLYLTSIADMPVIELFLLMLSYGIVSFAFLMISCIIFFKKEEIKISRKQSFKRDRKEKANLGLCIVLFVFEVLVAARIIDYKVGFVTVAVMIAVMDIKTFTKIDYSLLFTFVFLFIFIGNLKRIPAVSEVLSSIIGGREILVSALASQVISNVPAAILLSGFSSNVSALIVGTNIGGLGTIIASMASLISFKQYTKTDGAKPGKFLAIFSAFNFVLLAILLTLAILDI